MRLLYLSIPTVNVNCCSPSRMQNLARKLCLHQGPLDVARAKINCGLGVVCQGGHLLQCGVSDRESLELWGSVEAGDISSWGVRASKRGTSGLWRSLVDGVVQLAGDQGFGGHLCPGHATRSSTGKLQNFPKGKILILSKAKVD